MYTSEHIFASENTRICSKLAELTFVQSPSGN